jgi:hypothetical protein
VVLFCQFFSYFLVKCQNSTKIGCFIQYRYNRCTPKVPSPPLLQFPWRFLCCYKQTSSSEAIHCDVIAEKPISRDLLPWVRSIVQVTFVIQWIYNCKFTLSLFLERNRVRPCVWITINTMIKITLLKITCFCFSVILQGPVNCLTWLFTG